MKMKVSALWNTRWRIVEDRRSRGFTVDFLLVDRLLFEFLRFPVTL